MTTVQRAVPLGFQVADALRRAIIVKAIPDGTLLVEAKLAEEYGVSRGPVRDALRVLEREGLMETSGRSARVITPTVEDIDELFALRGALERLALSRAMTHARTTLLGRLESALIDMRDATKRGDAEAFTRADLRFHSAFGEAAGQRRTMDVWMRYIRTIEDLLLVANLDHVRLGPALESHGVLYRLIATGDDAEALAELESHLDNSRLRVRREYPDA